MSQCAHMKDTIRDFTQKKCLSYRTLCSAAGSWRFIITTINAKISPHPLLYGDAGWQVYSICTALMTPCGCNCFRSGFHLGKWSTAKWLSARTAMFLVDILFPFIVWVYGQIYFCVCKIKCTKPFFRNYVIWLIQVEFGYRYLEFVYLAILSPNLRLLLNW